MRKNANIIIHDALKITLVYGLPTGLITGMILFIFKWISQYVLKATFSAYEFTRENPLYIPLLFLGLIVIAFIVAFFVTHERNAGGGAIGRAAGFVRGLLTFKWLRTLISTFISAQFVFLTGVPFGIEGPSVLIGTSVAGGVNNVSKASKAYKSYILTSGAATTAFRGYKYSSDFNLWRTLVDVPSDLTTHFYYAPGWNQIADPGFRGNAQKVFIKSFTRSFKWGRVCFTYYETIKSCFQSVI